jgi:hypothetical protein
MRRRTCATAEREGIRVVTRGEKWCRPQSVGKNTATIAMESPPSVFERHFGPFAGGVVLVWVLLRANGGVRYSGDTILNSGSLVDSRGSVR